jgi:hypothetical protein
MNGQDIVNVTESHSVFVQVRAGIDIINHEATWELQALDPETGIGIESFSLVSLYITHMYTGEPPADPSVGFLPPNNGTTGQGFVMFSVQADDEVESLSRIDATATIIFDQNEPIATPPIFNTVRERTINAESEHHTFT